MRARNNVHLIAFTLAGLLLLPFYAQEALGQQALTRPVQKPSECEFIKHALNDTLLRAKEPHQSKIIFVFYKGEGEKSEDVITRRIINFEKFLKAEIPDLGGFLMTEGKRRTLGLGKTEIYVRGELTFELFFNRNAIDCVN